VIEPTPLLVRRYLAEDKSAFSTLVQRYQNLVFSLCFRMLGHREDAEDAVQETFTRVARHIDGWDDQRPIEPWLLTIAGNRCRTHLSRRRRDLPLLDGAEPASNATEQQRTADVLDEEVQLALSDLRDQHRTAFLMFHQDQLSYAEIAEKMDCPVGTVKTWVHRARTDLIDRLRQREVLVEQRHAV
jgi:RNA polymerase sigma-70 factor (ECF subfamily)